MSSQLSRTVGTCAANVSCIGVTLSRSAADRAMVGQPVNTGLFRPQVQIDAEHRRDDITGFLNQNSIADSNIQQFNIVLIMQSRPG